MVVTDRGGVSWAVTALRPVGSMNLPSIGFHRYV